MAMVFSPGQPGHRPSYEADEQGQEDRVRVLMPEDGATPSSAPGYSSASADFMWEQAREFCVFFLQP